jgi:hypothetical protein
MNSVRKARFPKSSYAYGDYGWHLAWTVDVAGRTAIHASGLVFKFSSGVGGVAKPPLGGRCPCGAWYGELVGGADSLPAPYKEFVAIRLCLEAQQLFSDMASHACQDCPEDTLGGDYYMVHNDLWNRAHPNRVGMLCLPCLELRVGRRLRVSDFTNAPINPQRRIAEFCSESRHFASANRETALGDASQETESPHQSAGSRQEGREATLCVWD